LLLISTGNIRNSELEPLLISNLENIADKLNSFDFVEITRKAIISHV
jgi:predicted nuclease of predicted toxin-antitoxin system